MSFGWEKTQIKKSTHISAIDPAMFDFCANALTLPKLFRLMANSD